MKRTISGALKAAASLAVAGGMIVAAALPAAAASPNDSTILVAGGLITLGPLDQATFPGTAPIIDPGLTLAETGGLLSTGLLTDAANGTTASSDVANVALNLLASTLTAGAVDSSCAFNTATGTVSGTTTITNGAVNLPLVTIPLDTTPAVNDVVAGVGTLGSIVLNAQSTDPDGTLHVTALQITLLGGQTISLGQSKCNAADLAAVPMLPGKTLPVAGGLGALVIAGMGYQLRRRRTAAER
jgi:hypothetical protein